MSQTVRQTVRTEASPASPSDVPWFSEKGKTRKENDFRCYFVCRLAENVASRVREWGGGCGTFGWRRWAGRTDVSKQPFASVFNAQEFLEEWRKYRRLCVLTDANSWIRWWAQRLTILHKFGNHSASSSATPLWSPQISHNWIELYNFISTFDFICLETVLIWWRHFRVQRGLVTITPGPGSGDYKKGKARESKTGSINNKKERERERDAESCVR